MSVVTLSSDLLPTRSAGLGSHGWKELALRAPQSPAKAAAAGTPLHDSQPGCLLTVTSWNPLKGKMTHSSTLLCSPWSLPKCSQSPHDCLSLPLPWFLTHMNKPNRLGCFALPSPVDHLLQLYPSRSFAPSSSSQKRNAQKCGGTIAGEMLQWLCPSLDLIQPHVPSSAAPQVAQSLPSQGTAALPGCFFSYVGVPNIRLQPQARGLPDHNLATQLFCPPSALTARSGTVSGDTTPVAVPRAMVLLRIVALLLLLCSQPSSYGTGD